MKLIDLLVQELPKRGGWPEGWGFVAADEDGAIYSYENKPTLDMPSKSWVDNEGDGYHEANALTPTKVCDWDEAVVSKEQYEAALAASKQPVWSGEGLPPVGIKCLTIGAHGDDPWYECTILAHTEFSGKPVAVFQYGDIISHSSAKWFKPLPTEAERKREGICDSIFGAMSKAERKENRSDMAEEVYDAIAAGKIPGVKLVD